MTRWIAPILSFTADEVWENMPGPRADLGVFTAEWYDGLFAYANSEIDESTWDSLEQLRAEVTRCLEGLRQDGKIGSSLDAEVTILADQALIDELQVISDELRFVLITSAATLAPLDSVESEDVFTLRNGSRILVQATPSEYPKCVRCWHHREDVGSHTDHAELCARCIDHIDGDGEHRRYA